MQITRLLSFFLSSNYLSIQIPTQRQCGWKGNVKTRMGHPIIFNLFELDLFTVETGL